MHRLPSEATFILEPVECSFKKFLKVSGSPPLLHSIFSDDRVSMGGLFVLAQLLAADADVRTATK